MAPLVLLLSRDIFLDSQQSNSTRDVNNPVWVHTKAPIPLQYFEILVLVTGSVSPPLIMPSGNKASRNQLDALIHKHSTKRRNALLRR